MNEGYVENQLNLYETAVGQQKIELDWNNTFFNPNISGHKDVNLRTLIQVFRNLDINKQIRKFHGHPMHIQSYGIDNIESGFYGNTTTGRSEQMVMRLTPEDSSFEATRDIIMAACPWLKNDKVRVEKMLQAGINIKVKGRSWNQAGRAEKQLILLSEHFIKQQGIGGFTGLDSSETIIPDKLVGTHKVIDTNGEEVEYEYAPSRVLLFAVPIQKIHTSDGKNIEPLEEKWTEPLYVEVFLEFGGFNLEELEGFDSNAMTDNDWAEYLKRISIPYKIFDDLNSIDLSDEEYIRKFNGVLIKKYWFDSQLQAKFLWIGYNRTKHNSTVMDFQDLDDCRIKINPPDIHLDFDKYIDIFYRKFSYLFFIRKYKADKNFFEVLEKIIANFIENQELVSIFPLYSNLVEGDKNKYVEILEKSFSEIDFDYLDQSKRDRILTEYFKFITQFLENDSGIIDILLDKAKGSFFSSTLWIQLGLANPKIFPILIDKLIKRNLSETIYTFLENNKSRNDYDKYVVIIKKAKNLPEYIRRAL